jgi:type I restriction enzyme S subunit
LKRVAKVPASLHGEIASTAFCVLRPDPGQLDPDFLFFVACSDAFVAAVAEHETGASYPAVRDKDLLDRNIDVPPLAVQQRVARVLKSLRSAVLRQIALIGMATDLKASAMRELFARGPCREPRKETEIGPIPESWSVTTFSEVREWLQYGTSIHCTLEPRRFPVLRIPNIEPGRVNASDLKYCNLSEEDGNKYLLENGDLLFIRTNGVLERLGSCAVYDGEPQKALFASYLIRARLKPGIDPRYVAYFYASQRGTSLVAGRATPAADGKYNLNTGTIDSLPLPLPSTLDEQRDVVAILDAIDRKIDLHQRKRAVLEDLFKALLPKLMTGEIAIDELDLSALNRVSVTAEEAAV